jgi:hypothetical protein
VIELLGAEKVEHDFGGIAHRLNDATPIMARQARTLEAAERGVFAELGGRYVDTGRTMRSLTLPASEGAIRRATRGSLEFGTDVRYARYLTEHIGPPTAAGGMERPKPVAVLKLGPATRQQIAHDVMDQVVHGESDTTAVGAFVGGML